MLNGLDLFSGIGGISIALSQWVRTVAYCENEPYAQAVILSRIASGELDNAPIWDDVTTLSGLRHLPANIDIVYGGFPCQDISVAGAGVGLGGERSGLYFEVERLVREIAPTFVFLENVPAIRTRGLERVVKGLSSLGYDCRWTTLSASQVGAPHKRERWFLLARRADAKSLSEREQADQTYAKSVGGEARHESFNVGESVPNSLSIKLRDEQGRSGWTSREGLAFPRNNGETESLAHPESVGRSQGRPESEGEQGRSLAPICGPQMANAVCKGREGLRSPRRGEQEHSQPCPPAWWATEPDVGRVAHGVPARVDRIRGLGNAVVPLQARTAFEMLMGLR